MSVYNLQPYLTLKFSYLMQIKYNWRTIKYMVI